MGTPGAGLSQGPKAGFLWAMSNPYEPYPRPGMSAGAVLALSFVLSVVAAVGVHLVMNRLAPAAAAPPAPLKDRVVVPPLTGTDLATARSKLAAAGLLLTVHGRGAGDSARVVDQRPTSGSTLRADDAVTVAVEGGPALAEPAGKGAAASRGAAPAAKVAVPDLVGRDAPAAAELLAKAKLAQGPVTTKKDAAARGKIIAQAPLAGAQAAPGTKVSLVLSDGPGTVTVPSLVDLLVPEARGKLEGVGLKLGAVTERDDTKPKGAVLAQVPARGKVVAPGTKVDVAVSTGQVLVTIPKLRRKPERKAKAILKGLGLKVRVSEMFHDSIPTGYVIKTKPADGTKVAPGTLVRLYVTE